MKRILLSLILTLFIKVSVAQQIDSLDSASFVTEIIITEMAENENIIEELKVWPAETSFKVSIDIDHLETVEIKNCVGRTVKTLKVDKGQCINVETLIPGSYTIKAGNKVGKFIKK
ncbi:MAG: hypothetical protein MJ211_01240 [Bacteroidales bacterium]|nr:hypothetical protein [Bacteroidales bacterium]